MPPNAREIEIPEPEYTDMLNVTVTEKKRKLCADIIGASTGGSNVRVKKENGKYTNNNDMIQASSVVIRLGYQNKSL